MVEKINLLCEIFSLEANFSNDFEKFISNYIDPTIDEILGILKNILLTKTFQLQKYKILMTLIKYLINDYISTYLF